MVDDNTLKWANAQSSYEVTPMRNPDGTIAPHYLDEIASHGMDFDALMQDALFAQIVDCELAAERRANGPLSHLAEHASSQRVHDVFLHWLAFVNGDLQPWTTGGAIHFRPHWARVLMLALTICDEQGLNDTDLAALAMASVFHDSRRRNPYLDTGHGARAAAYYQLFSRDAADGRRTHAGRTIAFDPRTYLAIFWHDRDDSTGFTALERAVAANALADADLADLAAAIPQGAQATAADVLSIFKDADALDRIRLGASGLDPSYLRTPAARTLIPFANRLLAATES